MLASVMADVIAMIGVMADVLAMIGVTAGARPISSRSRTGRRDTYLRFPVGVHTLADTDPGDSLNMNRLVAFELTHASPQRF